MGDVMNDGYIKVFRQILSWEWYDDVNVFKLWIHLLLIVNHKDNKWRGEIVKRGSTVTSYAQLSYQTGLSIQEVKTALKKLQKTGEVTKVTSSKNTVVIVTNYDKYQDTNKQSNNQSNKESNQQLTNNQQDSNKVATTNNNDKNDKNDKKDKKENKETYKEIVSRYTQNESLLSSLNDFIDMRKKMKGFTTKALTLALNNLDKLSYDDNEKIDIVNQSVMNSWKSFYPIKKDMLTAYGEDIF